ncbi:bifunctional metallophosphatase/5'-nucleotidase [Vibrio aestuarianus]|uniref:Bifunctional metallophosphatase/5'-nucleotidase n=1 Tax=Vibrio aestuarianus TaxID=28171 RepID=A0A9X4FDR0_9VIBR|nr:bifunctional UDP-sugar hydrolase/5'-nucleotidase [Vibrio aestuarianus]MDE1263210.1 bifunctional metallophosphatase/5'-nucleotidase [Vibrio aestuarianus]MDE1297119.1 bifunctional metallophosphatase/5'-nucleotidase [Vibrio aestuarianus]MDE1311248.1 bifunctional metallophosphatase/5'-nucleotidase [Vibrio aestuarianus]MDE1327406.1 bifunctional metallophosphatase/5'-nucleotidase [Vibrio aestuarianus]MDE1356848.1 bifunctional metallophosphatase/5'-nucleotidase [Vibrio aestuarianus]
MKLKIVTSAILASLAIPSFAADGDIHNVTVLGTSDIHGHFMPWDYAADKSNMHGSLSQIATKVKQIREQDTHVILVDAGDTIQGNFVETFKHEAVDPMMLGFNEMQYDVWVLGNHEFDFGLAVLNRSLTQFEGKALAGNIQRPDGNPFLPAYTVIEKDNIKIGVIGMDTPMTQVFAEGTNRLEGMTFTNPTLEVKKIVQRIKNNVDAIVLVAHMGLDNENDIQDTGVSDIANANPEIDAIVAGHMHTKIDKAVVNGVIITEPDKYGRALSRIDFQFEERGGKYTLINKDSFTYSISGVDSDTKMEQLYAPYHDRLRQNANREIAQLNGIDLVPENEIRGIPQVHIQDTGISALFQEASFFYAPKANVIALQIDNDNAELDVGPIKAKDIAYNYQYAGGEITVYQMTGKELKAYMEWSAGYFNSVQDGDVTYSFNPKRRASKYSTNDFFAGVTYTIDLSQPEGQRIKDLSFADGQRIQDNSEIRLGMNSYRMGHLTQKGGSLEGRTFPVIFDTEAEYGEDEGTIRNLAIRYLTEEKKGQYEGKLMQRWKLVGLHGYDAEREVVKNLINSGQIDVPSSDDGRYSNIASINVKALKFDSKEMAKEALDTRIKLIEKASSVEKINLNREIVLIKALNDNFLN